MRDHLIPFALLLIVPTANAQEVIGTSGQNYATSSITVSQTVGEAFIGTLSNGISAHQGFHQVGVLITSVAIEHADIQASVFPNPFTEQVRIDGTRAIGSVDLFDMAGQLIGRFATGGTGNSLTLDLSSFTQGQYLLRVNAAGERSCNTYQVIKQ